jgi:hypothetical protein
VKGWDEELSKTVLCECSGKTIGEAISVFQGTDLPYKKAKKLVTECDKTCCRQPLQKLFDMTYFGEFDMPEIVRLIEIRNNRLKQLFEDIVPS